MPTFKLTWTQQHCTLIEADSYQEAYAIGIPKKEDPTLIEYSNLRVVLTELKALPPSDPISVAMASVKQLQLRNDLCGYAKSMLFDQNLNVDEIEADQMAQEGTFPTIKDIL